MEIRYEIGSQERSDALAAAASRGQREAVRLMLCMMGGAALSLLWPFGPDLHGLIRAAFGALLAGAGFVLAQEAARFWERYCRYRAGLTLDPDDARGLEPGVRIVRLDLDGLRERGPLGERRIAWSEVESIAEHGGTVALQLGEGDVVLFPRDALERAGIGDVNLLTTLAKGAAGAAYRPFFGGG